MRAFLWISAVLTGLVGITFAAATVTVMARPAGNTPNPHALLPGYVLCAAGGLWCLFVSARFVHRRNYANAVHVGRAAGVLLFLILAGIAVGLLLQLEEHLHPIVILGAPFAAAVVSWLYYGRVHEPLARRAFASQDAAAAIAKRGVDEELPRSDLGQLRVVLEPAPELMRQLRARFLKFGVPLWVIAVTSGLYIANHWAPDVLISAASSFVIGLLAAFSWLMAFRKQERNLASLRIALCDHGILRTQNGSPSISFRFDEIQAVAQIPGVGIQLLGAQPTERLFVPRELTDFSMLESRLPKVRLIDTMAAPHAQWITARASVLLVLYVLAALILAFVSQNRMVVTIAAGSSIVLLGTCVAIAWRSPHTDGRTKRTMLAVVFPMAGLALRLWLVWSIPE